MDPAAPFPLPFAPRRIVIGSNLHAALGAWIRVRRPELEVRGAKYTDVPASDLAWGEVYIGFRRPPSDPSLGSIRWVHGTGAGVDGFLLPEPISPKILLTKSPEPFGPMIAEWVVARIFAFQQQLPSLAEAQRERRWAPRDVARVAGTRALIVGTGEIGTAIARTLGALGCEVTGVSRSGVARRPASSSESSSARGEVPFAEVRTVSALPELVGEADWIILTLPATEETRNLVSRDLLARCRGAVLLNAGRGAVVEESALPEALAQGWLRGAALDVFVEEPLPPTSPLWADSRVMVSPHISGITTVEGAGVGFLASLAALESGRLPEWVVDRARGY